MNDIGHVSKAKTTFFFPLRTNVGYFDAHKYHLPLLERIKQSALFYDQLVFEKGIYTATVFEHGVYDLLLPSDLANSDFCKFLREGFIPEGGVGGMHLQIGDRPPVEISGRIVRSFISEFHTLLEQITDPSMSWIKMDSYTIGKDARTEVDQMKEAFGKYVEMHVPNNLHYLKSKILDNLSHDLVLASSMEADVSIDGIYAPILRSAIPDSKAPGFAAIKVALPNLAATSWDKIISLRDKPSLVEFRRKMFDLEMKVLDAIGKNSIEDISDEIALHQAFANELSSELADAQPRKGEVVGNAVLDIIFGFAPYFNTFTSSVRGFEKISRANKSWVAAFLRLKSED